jgi:putative tryptophan/tyrosine transport system substrate-binding protein
MTHIGVPMQYAENDLEGQLRARGFRQGLENLGWVVGRNLQIDFHWGVGDADWMRSASTWLMCLAPDVILAKGDAAAKTLQQSTRTVPVIFIAGSEPVAEGLVQSLATPGGNLTGFSVLEPSVGTKLLELLKEIAPRVARVAILFNRDNSGNRRISSWAAGAAPRFAVEVVVAPLREPSEIEAAMAQWGREPNYGLIVLPDPSTNSYRKLIVELAARHRLPAIQTLPAATADGGLMSYGVDLPRLPIRHRGMLASRVPPGCATISAATQSLPAHRDPRRGTSSCRYRCR